MAVAALATTAADFAMPRALSPVLAGLEAALRRAYKFLGGPTKLRIFTTENLYRYRFAVNERGHEQQEAEASKNVGTAVGAALGTLAGCAIIIPLLVFLQRRRM